ncbi:MAG: GDP-mannose 4,6-dehydratase [Marinobacter sp.]|nr:GDP-mannose 4,6-dehydratase [Marinobacter sp.]
MSLLVTGLNGFVGSYLCKAEDCLGLPADLDLRDSEGLKRAVAAIRPEFVIHLAAQSFVPRAFEDPAETFDVNFYGTFNLLQALKDAGFQGRMLFVGSGDMYGLVGEEALPVAETHPLRPRNPYAVSKVAAEALCYQWSQTEDFEIVMARPFNHIGPGQSSRFAIADFAGQIAEIAQGRREPVLQVGDIDVTRDFLDVRDVVNAYLALLNKGVNGEVYNVCSGHEHSVRALIEQLVHLAGISDLRIEQDARRFRPAEQRRVRGDSTKLQTHTGWEPRTALVQSLSEMLGL